MKNETENSNELKDRETETDEKAEASPDEDSRLKGRVSELEESLSAKDSEINVLKQNAQELENRCKTLGDSLSEAVSGYREMVVQSNPGILSEMITGDTVRTVNESLESARVLVNRIKQGLETEITQGRIPAGSPERSSPDLSSLSPGEKIRYALGGNE